MQITSRCLNVLVAHQHLNGSQIRSLFEQVGSKTMPEGVRCNVFLDSGFACGGLHGFPDHLGRDRFVGTPAVAGAGKQIRCENRDFG